MPELIMVIALLALAALITIPLTTRKIGELRVRSAADQFIVSLRAVRMAAVTLGTDVEMQVRVNPDNRYEWIDTDGREHRIELPQGVIFTATSTAVIRFRANGSLDPPTPATTIIEAPLPRGKLERWTVTTAVSGIPSMISEIENQP